MHHIYIPLISHENITMMARDEVGDHSQTQHVREQQHGSLPLETVLRSQMRIMCAHESGYSSGRLPGLVNIQKAIENGPVEIVDFSIKHGDFP
jgi:hypothetical protein